MSASHSTDNVILSMISAVSAVVSLSAIQPVLTFIASLIAIASGLYSFVKKSKKK